ncbi:13009_t:CDS:2 [Dentiscutata erythropus]|uniref:13009_t:CDS:1 n=1 Tax=Dentiscutata erythropus TaxID=1348616 RepID=A0A9N9H9N2_9GLOM|nr:13009_t:CDS:2 [Dentiscutata erythropus]
MSSFKYDRYHPYEQESKNENNGRNKDQDQDAVYGLHIVDSFRRKGECEINLLGLVKNIRFLVQCKFEKITPSDVRNFTEILAGHSENTLGIFAAPAFSKKARTFAATYPRQIFFIMDNLNDQNNIDEIYNDIIRYLIFKENEKIASNLTSYHRDIKRIGQIKATVKNQSFAFLNLKIHGNGESVVEIHDITF